MRVSPSRSARPEHMARGRHSQEEARGEIGVHDSMPKEVAECRNDCWCGKGKCVSQFCDQDARCFPLICVQPLANCGSDGCIRIDTRSVTIQGQQVRLFRGLREGCFCMNDIASASLVGDLAS